MPHPRGFAALLSDSIEAGPAELDGPASASSSARAAGYDPLRWLPTLAGWLVGERRESDRFLFDYRRTLAELLAEQYYGTLGGEARRRGMTYYAEALEDGRPSARRRPGDARRTPTCRWARCGRSTPTTGRGRPTSPI